LLKRRYLGGVGHAAEPRNGQPAGQGFTLHAQLERSPNGSPAPTALNEEYYGVCGIAANLPVLLFWLQPSAAYLQVATPPRERGLMKGEEIQAEMIQLLKLQTEAVEKEVFGGLTDAEEQEYGERKERISELQTMLHIKPAV
jgi:hypothetical protein